MKELLHKNIKIQLVCLLPFFTLVCLLFNPRTALAYAQHTTHPALTVEIAELFNLKNDNTEIELTAEQIGWLQQGAIEEDKPPRWINHFYNPETGLGWTGAHFSNLSEKEGYNQGGKFAPRLSLPSTNWITNQEYQAAYAEQFGNQTWPRAIKYYLDGNKKAAFVALGHALHLIEDATVPDHTRNDSHSGLGPDEDGSPYESFADLSENYINLQVAENLHKTLNKLPTYESIEEVIKTNAIYSHNNFFSEDTISNEENKWPDLGEFRKQNSKDKFIIEKFANQEKNKYLYDEIQKIFLAKIKLDPSSNNGVYYTTSDSHYVLPSYLSHLYPQAVSSGAGAIQLFFKQVEFFKRNPMLLGPIVADETVTPWTIVEKIALNPIDEISNRFSLLMIERCSEIGDHFCTDTYNTLNYNYNFLSTAQQVQTYLSSSPTAYTTSMVANYLLWLRAEYIKTEMANGPKNEPSIITLNYLNDTSKTDVGPPAALPLASPNSLPVASLLPAPTSTAPSATTFKPPQGNLVLYPTTPKPLSTTIEPLVAATVRTPDPVVLGNGSLAKVTLSDSARSKQIVDSFNAYLEALHRLEQARAPGEAGAMPTAEDVRSVVGAAELRSAVDLVGKVTTQEQLSAQLSDSSTTPAAVAGLLLILSLSLSSWALSYEEARLQAERMRVLDKEASDFKVAALQAEEQAIKEALAKIVVPTPKLFRTDDWIDPNGKHFPVYGFVVNGVWHNILDTSEVERIFGKENTLPRVSYGSYSNGWDSVHGGGTVGGAMTLRQLWQMQAAVIHDGTLPSTIEQYARGEKGTMHPLGWTFTPSQMYNPQNKTIYIVDQSSMGRFSDVLGWTAISTDTPKTNISNLAFDTPEAFLNKTPWDKEITLRNLEYQPNQTYHAPVTTDFEKYFKEERAKGRSTEDIYQHNPFQVIAVPNQTNSGQTTSAPTTSVPLATPTWIIPFRSGLTKKQQDSITTLLNNRYQSHTTLNETDAKNYAFAIGEVNVVRFVGRYAEEVGVRV